MSPSQFHSLLKSTPLDKLRAAVKTTTFENSNSDEGYWKPTVDKAGNGSAIIRFLPAPPPESLPFVTFYRHAFEGPNGWYIELSRTTLGENDPLGEYNSRLWSTKDEALRDQVRKQSRKQTYVSNIYVIQDKGNPENEGKMFLFRYGKKIFEKIKKAIEPEYEQDTPFDPFHVIEGANFRLRQKKQAGFPNYDDSVFESSSPLLKGDEKSILHALNNLRSLTGIVAPDKFKSYDDLKKKLDRIMGFDTSVYLTPTDAPNESPVRRSLGRTEEPAVPLPPVARPWTPPVVSDDEEVDSLLSKFDDD
jgi:hypothetical protein